MYFLDLLSKAGNSLLPSKYYIRAKHFVCVLLCIYLAVFSNNITRSDFSDCIVLYR